MKTVAVAAPGTATREELPLSAGPAGFASLELEDASPGESAERIYVFANGPTGRDNPQRQVRLSFLEG